MLRTFVLAGALLCAFVGGLAVGERDGREEGERRGRIDEVYGAHSDAAGSYLNCLAEPPACDPQKRTYLWTLSRTDRRLAELGVPQ